ncbi:MAG: chorismate-binding protein [Myxococcales bacterium]|nr:chorismate-binding protein [Myxococcales bacterium]MDH5305598.1 chorismate-binding protein [Myxococcales bacterium]MDH5565244.1 chorismate-binding protein [Myxococcales bacterium]
MKPTPALAELDRVVSEACAAARRERRAQWVAARALAALCDPLQRFAAAAEAGTERFFWERPAQGVALAATGAAAVIETRGAERFADAAAAARALCAVLHVCGEPRAPSIDPLLVAGFACVDTGKSSPVWAGFPPGRLVLPECAWVRAPDATWHMRVRRVEPGANAAQVAAALRRDLAADAAEARDAQCAIPSSHSGAPAAPAYRARADRTAEAYAAGVAEALRALAAGEFEKVVLARSVRIDCERPFAACEVLDALRSSYPSCTIFAVGHADATFLGATPERLLRLEGRRVETAALAGSAPRGHSPEEDAALSRALLESKKEQSEHAVVARELRGALAPLCDVLHAPEAPAVLRLEGIQHLETPIQGTLSRAQHILELADRLHPTSAVAGAPRDAALRWLDRHEAVERGWYGGAIGFVTAAGGGELAVALRSALLRGRTAHLFAGAGIVVGSQPGAELQETRLKLRALLTPLLEI